MKRAIAAIAGQGLYRGCTAVLLVVAARTLSLEDFGRLSFGVAIAALVQAITLYGFDTELLRGMAAGQRGVEDAMAVLRTKSLIAVLVVVTGVAVVPLGEGDHALALALMLPLSGVMAALAETPETVLAAAARYNARGLVQGVPAAVTTAAAILVGSMTASASLSIFAALILARETIRLGTASAVARVAPSVATGMRHIVLARDHLASAWPFAAVAVLGYLYFRLDVLLLGALDGAAAVAYFSAAYFFLTAVSGIVTALSPLMLTALTRRPELYGRYRFRLFFVGLATSLVVGVAGPMLVTPLFGAGFDPAKHLVVILACVFPFSFMNSLALRAVYARHMERAVPKILLLATSINLVGNLAFIPLWGASACAIMTLATEACLSVCFLRTLGKQVELRVDPQGRV